MNLTDTRKPEKGHEKKRYGPICIPGEIKGAICKEPETISQKLESIYKLSTSTWLVVKNIRRIPSYKTY
jgi:hypothetical protein